MIAARRAAIFLRLSLSYYIAFLYYIAFRPIAPARSASPDGNMDINCGCPKYNYFNAFIFVQRIPSKGRWILARAYLSHRFLRTRWIEIILV